MKPRIALVFDLLSVLGLSLVYVLSRQLMPASALQAMLGLPFALILPGFAIQVAIYPRQDELELSLRLALGCVLSLTLVTILAMGLNAIGQLNVVWITSILELIIVVCCLVAWRRRSCLVSDSQVLLPRLVWESHCQRIWVLFAGVLVIAGLILVTGAFVDLLGGKRSQTSTTAFYLLGENGRAGNYSERVKLGQSFPVILGVINNEQKAMTYRIEMQIDDQDPQTLAQVSLQPGETWKQTFDTVIKGVDANSTAVLVRFNLYNDFGGLPYRSLHQRLQIVDLK